MITTVCCFPKFSVVLAGPQLIRRSADDAGFNTASEVGAGRPNETPARKKHARVKRFAIFRLTYLGLFTAVFQRN
jgi:hypothetical protein